jgi:hypothetical protein
MNRTILTGISLVFTLYSIHLCAQDDSTFKRNLTVKYSYVNSGFGVSKGLLLGIGGNIIFSNNWGASVSYCGNIMKAKELPSDYSAGLIDLFEWQDLGTDKLKDVSARLVKELPVKIKVLRFALEGGASVIHYRCAHFTPVPNPGWFGSNYDVTYTHNTGIGVSLRAKAEFPVTRYAGFEVALISDINQYYSFLGTEIHLTFGILRDRIIPE